MVACSLRSKVKFKFEITPAFTTFTVFNPKDNLVSLKLWLDSAADHLITTKLRGRGRGLAVAIRCADQLEEVSGNGIKLVSYRDYVDILTIKFSGYIVFGVLTGQSNPSLGRRIADLIDPTKSDVFIIVLNPNELEKLTEYVDRKQMSPALKEALKKVGKIRESHDSGTYSGTYSGTQSPTQSLRDIVSTQFEPNYEIIIVTENDAIINLFPQDFAYRHLKDALAHVRSSLPHENFLPATIETYFPVGSPDKSL